MRSQVNGASSETEPGGGAAHRIPAIDRMMDLLAVLERRPDGATIRELVEAQKLPRTTVYRILNTLQHHDAVRRLGSGRYRLGPRLLALAARVEGDGPSQDLVAASLPHMERLSAETGEGCKISVVYGDELLVRAAVNGTREYALSVTPGQRLPMHAGAAGKLLLAHMPDADRNRVLAAPLERYSSRTITDPRRLVATLAQVRRLGYATDKGESSPSIHAFAAPIYDRAGAMVAAISVPFLAGSPAAHAERIRRTVIATAAAISADVAK